MAGSSVKHVIEMVFMVIQAGGGLGGRRGIHETRFDTLRGRVIKGIQSE